MTIHSQNNQQPFLLDTGPLSVLCGFPLNGNPYIFTVLQFAEVSIPDVVASEIKGSGKLARIIIPLLKRGTIKIHSTPTNPTILDVAYGKMLGLGERSVIKVALSIKSPVVIDDRDAYIVACRFGLQPIGFQDFIVTLAHNLDMSSELAIEICKSTARQFPAPYLIHTLELLKEE